MDTLDTLSMAKLIFLSLNFDVICSRLELSAPPGEMNQRLSECIKHADRKQQRDKREELWKNWKEEIKKWDGNRCTVEE